MDFMSYNAFCWDRWSRMICCLLVFFSSQVRNRKFLRRWAQETCSSSTYSSLLHHWASHAPTCHPGTFSGREKLSWAALGFLSCVSAQCSREKTCRPELARTRNFPPLTSNEWFLFCWKFVMEFLHSVPRIRFFFPVIVSYLSPRSIKRNKNIWNRGVFDSLPWKHFRKAFQLCLLWDHEVS